MNLDLTGKSEVLNAYAVLIAATPGSTDFAAHQAYIAANGIAGYKAALNGVFQQTSTATLATSLLKNLHLDTVFSQADGEAFLTANETNRVGAMIDLAIALYNYTGPVQILLNAQAVYVPEIDASLNYSSNPANVSGTALASLDTSIQTFAITATAPDILEGNSGSSFLTYTVTLDKAPVSPITVNYKTLTSGTATSGADFVPVTGTLDFAAGQTVATAAITVNGDTVFEPNETVDVQFSVGNQNTSVTATGIIKNDDVDPGSLSQTFTLTTGNDTIPGLIGSSGTNSNSGDDTISALIQNSGNNGTTNESTLTSADSVNGGNGTDIMNVRVTSLTGSISIAPVLNGLETISVSSEDGSGNNLAIRVASLGQAESSSIKTVEFKDHGAGANTTFLNVPSSAVLSLDNADSGDGQKVNFASDTIRDSFKMTIANGSGSTSQPAGFQLVTANGTNDDTSFKTAHITVAGAASFVHAGTALASLTTINVSGAATGVTTGFGLTLTQAANFSNLKTVDASGLTGGGLSLDARDSTATGFTFTGSSADDRLVLSQTVINSGPSGSTGMGSGGLGKDTLASNSFNLQTSAINLTNGFEVLESVSPASFLSASQFTSINEFLFSGGANNGRIDISGVESSDRFVFSSDQGSSNGAMRFTGATVGQTVVMELRASSATDGEVTIKANGNTEDSVSAIKFDKISSVTIDSTGQNTTANLIESVKSSNGGDNYFAFDNSGGLSNFVITGSQSLTIGAREGVELGGNSRNQGFREAVNLNASSFVGALRIAGSSSDDTITGGSGNDIIYGVSGADTLTGNGGVDQFRFAGISGRDNIKDFAKGTDKIGFNNVDFVFTNANAEGSTLSVNDYVDNRSGITSIGSSDNHVVIELQTALSTNQITTDNGAAVTAYILVFNSATNKGELWFDNNWSDADSRSQVASFDNVVTLAGVTDFKNTDFVEFTV